ncbi:trypsin-like serine peptidase [Kitasatospora sp. NPDC050467]|uniref:trypsin-like serine peptidase n=1 Tax=Kitasatospora sp. NPDC050467 TaxID=3364053 RepID=UPI0037971E5F
MAPTSRVAVHAEAVTAAQQQAVLDYWTPQRITALTSPSSGNPPKSSPDGAPWTGAATLDKTVGRLFFTNHGEDESCTATVVDSANRSTVVTAAHCVNNTVPGYRNGTKPLGGFSIKYMATSSRWDADPGTTTSDAVAVAGYDTGILVANPAAGGRRIADVTGSQRIAFTKPAKGEFIHTFGYPKDRLNNPGATYAGSRMIHCAGPDRTGPDRPGPAPRPPSCGVSPATCPTGRAAGPTSHSSTPGPASAPSSASPPPPTNSRAGRPTRSTPHASATAPTASTTGHRHA